MERRRDGMEKPSDATVGPNEDSGPAGLWDEVLPGHLVVADDALRSCQRELRRWRIDTGGGRGLDGKDTESSRECARLLAKLQGVAAQLLKEVLMMRERAYGRQW